MALAAARINRTTAAGGYKRRMLMDRTYRPQSIRNRQLGGLTAPKGSAFNLFPEIADRVPAALGEIVIETTGNIATKADQKVPVGPDVGTHKGGTLKASQRIIYYRSRTNGEVVTGRIDYMAVDPPGSKHYYGFYVEVGTYKTRAQPFLLPSLISERQPFYDKCRHLEDRL